jgi:hypothetical protein
MPKNELYHLLQSSTLVGLFTCVFVKSHLRDRIKNLSTTEVKRGMGGLHGNKVRDMQFCSSNYMSLTSAIGCPDNSIRRR